MKGPFRYRPIAPGLIKTSTLSHLLPCVTPCVVHLGGLDPGVFTFVGPLLSSTVPTPPPDIPPRTSPRLPHWSRTCFPRGYSRQITRMKDDPWSTYANFAKVPFSPPKFSRGPTFGKRIRPPPSAGVSPRTPFLFFFLSYVFVVRKCLHPMGAEGTLDLPLGAICSFPLLPFFFGGR